MKANEIRYHLHNFEQLKDEIVELTENLREYRDMEIDAFRVPVNDGMPKHFTQSSQVETVAIPRLAYIEKQENRLFYLKSILAAINHVIKQYPVESLEWKILKLRYLKKDNGKTMDWERVADKINYSSEWCRHVDVAIIREIMGTFADNLAA
jgi:hypothetical protein